MELHIFKCKADESIFGLTPDITGDNLPANGCKEKWEFWKTANIEKGMKLIGGIDEDIINGVEAIGFHIVNDGIQLEKI
jgi:hypothetical protein